MYNKLVQHYTCTCPYECPPRELQGKGRVRLTCGCGGAWEGSQTTCTCQTRKCICRDPRCCASITGVTTPAAAPVEAAAEAPELEEVDDEPTTSMCPCPLPQTALSFSPPATCAPPTTSTSMSSAVLTACPRPGAPSPAVLSSSPTAELRATKLGFN